MPSALSSLMPWICAPFWAPSMVTGPVEVASVPLPVLPSWPVSISQPVSEDDPDPPHALRAGAEPASPSRGAAPTR